MVDQSKHVRFGSSPLAWVILGIIALLALAGTTTAIAVGTSGPNYPELEGDWRLSSSRGTIVIHISDDKFTIDVATEYQQQFRCAGKIIQETDLTYTLISTQGVCEEMKVTLAQDDESLIYYDNDGDSHHLRR